MLCLSVFLYTAFVTTLAFRGYLLNRYMSTVGGLYCHFVLVLLHMIVIPIHI